MLVAHGEHRRHGHRLRRGEPAQAGSLGGEELWRRRRMGLGEHPPTVAEVDAPRAGHVAAVHTRRAHNLVAERRGDRLPQRLVDHDGHDRNRVDERLHCTAGT